MRRRAVFPLLAGAALSLPALTVPVPAVAAPQAVVANHSSIDHQVRAAMAGMTLPEKIGQMFVTYVYGDSATTATPADVAQNQALYGADVHNGAELLSKYHL